jgi:hypothetical protein
MSFECDFATLKSFFIDHLNRIFFVTKFELKVSIYIFFFFVQIRGVQPVAHEPEFFCAVQTGSRIFRHFDHFPSVFFFGRLRLKSWEKSELRLREKLWIERPWFRLRALKSSILKADFVGCQLELMKNYCELGDGVSSGRA